MHDVVAHSISIMVVQAGGARRILATDPDRAERAAARIRHAGSDALAEMDILLGVLESVPGRETAATLDALADLVAAHARGRPPRHPRSTRHAEAAAGGRRTGRLPSRARGAHQCHQARGRRDDARSSCAGARKRSSCAWPSAGDGGPSPQLAGAGHGLIGMRERIRVHGGELRGGRAARRRLRGRRSPAAASARRRACRGAFRVLIVDDAEARPREACGWALEPAPGIEVVGEAGDGATGVAEAERLRPDVVLMDVRMPELDGIEATRRIVALDGTASARADADDLRPRRVPVRGAARRGERVHRSRTHRPTSCSPASSPWRATTRWSIPPRRSR